jgi:hypothetical protein
MASKLRAWLERGLYEENFLSKTLRHDKFSRRRELHGDLSKRTEVLVRKFRPPLGQSIFERLEREALAEVTAAGHLDTFSSLIDDFGAAHRKLVQSCLNAAKRHKSHQDDGDLTSEWAEAFWRLEKRLSAVEAAKRPQESNRKSRAVVKKKSKLSRNEQRLEALVTKHGKSKAYEIAVAKGITDNARSARTMHCRARKK